MRLQATKLLRMPGGKGVVYQAGEEFDVPDDYKGRHLARILIASKQARKFEPTVIGSPPPLPVQKMMAPEPRAPEPPPESTPRVESTPEPSAPPPVFQPDEDVVSVEGDPSEASDEQEGDAPRRRGRPPIHGRYSRRDLRSED